MSDRSEFVIEEVIKPKLAELATNQKELMRALARMEGQSEASQVIHDVREIRSQVLDISHDLGKIVGAMEQSDDKKLSEAASGITFNVAGGNATDIKSHGDGANIAALNQGEMDTNT